MFTVHWPHWVAVDVTSGHTAFRQRSLKIVKTEASEYLIIIIIMMIMIIIITLILKKLLTCVKLAFKAYASWR